MELYKYICIEGNIGAGKTTLATALAQQAQVPLLLEQFEDNPFLPSYYENTQRFALDTELHFLRSRYKQMQQIQSNQAVVSDYWFDKSWIFARVSLPQELQAAYKQEFDTKRKQVRQPDLILFLEKDMHQLKKQIEQRGRPYEANISHEYLANVHNSYTGWLKDQNLTPIVVIQCLDANNALVPALLKDFTALTKCKWPAGITRLSL